jgi:tripartite-type tricarboxylate transporter receptor subunit TctC
MRRAATGVFVGGAWPVFCFSNEVNRTDSDPTLESEMGVVSFCRKIGAALPLIGLLACGAAPSPAAAEVSYKDKRITIVIGYGVGGTYYQYAHLFSDYLRKHLPDSPSIIVQSMPGAGGLKMLNYAATQMPADGTYLFVPPDTSVLMQLLEPSGIAFDLRQFRYVGTADQQNNIWVVRKAAAGSLADIKTREVIMGHSGRGSTGLMIPAVAKELLGLKVKLIGGYEGSRDAIHAMEQGEIDGAVFGWETWITAVPQWFEKGREFAVPILQVGITPDPDVPTVPMLSALAAKSDRPIVDLFGTIGMIGRGLALPPGAPDEHLKVLRAAFRQMLEDPEYRAEAARIMLRVLPTTGEDLQKAITAAIDNADVAAIERTRALTTVPK